jgi:aquaporin related protein
MRDVCSLFIEGVHFTGGSLNPARSLGPAVISHSFPGYFWIYWLGPLLGSLLACVFYVMLKYLRWKECNPGQDW